MDATHPDLYNTWRNNTALLNPPAEEQVTAVKTGF